MGSFILEKEDNKNKGENIFGNDTSKKSDDNLNKCFSELKKNENDIEIDFDEDKVKNSKVVTIMNLVKGAYAGIEIAFGNENYNYSLKATSLINFLYKININFLPELHKEIIEFLRPLYLRQKEIQGNLANKKQNIRIKIDNLFDKSNQQRQDYETNIGKN